MAKYDVVVIGAGAAGLTAGALLAKSGKKVLVMDRDKHLGGRGMAIPFEGYRLSLGGHLLEDGGSGITKIISYLGGELKHGKTSKGNRPVEMVKARICWKRGAGMTLPAA